MREAEGEAVGNRAAELAEIRRTEQRQERGTVRPQPINDALVYHDRKPVRVELLQFRHPPLVAGERLSRAAVAADGELARIAPARGFSDDGAINLRRERLQSSDIVGWRQHAAIEKMFLCAVAIHTTELGPCAQLIVESRGQRAVRETIHPVIAAQPVEGDFLIPRQENPFRGGQAVGGIGATACPIRVVRIADLQPVVRLHQTVQQEIINQVVQVHLCGHVLKIGFVVDAEVDQRDQAVPIRATAILQLGVVLEDVPIFFVTAEVIRKIRRAEPLDDVVDAPVKSVHVEMHMATTTREMIHVAHRFLDPLIAQIRGVLRTITQRKILRPRITAAAEWIVTRRPGVGPSRTQDDAVEVRHAAVIPVVVEPSRAEVGFEFEAKRVLRRAHVVASGLTVHLYAAVDLEL